ncbi:MAG: hypothetical protein GY844_35330 [Bradyrhizobium sp.]|nr:hypothetical protein [Bradyrhizobium sp.]
MNEVAVAPRRRKTAIWIWLLVAGGVTALLAANAHLLYVASASQPACVSHLRDAGDTAGQFRAAKSSCSPTAGASAEGKVR